MKPQQRTQGGRYAVDRGRCDACAKVRPTTAIRWGESLVPLCQGCTRALLREARKRRGGAKAGESVNKRDRLK